MNLNFNVKWYLFYNKCKQIITIIILINIKIVNNSIIKSSKANKLLSFFCKNIIEIGIIATKGKYKKNQQ